MERPMLPPGLYHLELYGVEESVSQHSKRPFKMIEFRLLVDGRITDKSLFLPVVQDDNAEWVWQQFCPRWDDLDAQIGAEFLIQVRKEQYGLETLERIGKVHARLI